MFDRLLLEFLVEGIGKIDHPRYETELAFAKRVVAGVLGLECALYQVFVLFGDAAQEQQLFLGSCARRTKPAQIFLGGVELVANLLAQLGELAPGHVTQQLGEACLQCLDADAIRRQVSPGRLLELVLAVVEIGIVHVGAPAPDEVVAQPELLLLA